MLTHMLRAVVVMYLTLGLLLTGMYMYLPHHLAFINTRAAYYLFGRDIDISGVTDFTDSFALLKNAASWGLNTSIASLGSLTGWGANAAAEL